MMDNNDLKTENGKNTKILFFPFFFLLSVWICIFAVLCISEIESLFVQKYLVALAFACTLFVSIFYGVSVWGVLSNKQATIKIMLSFGGLLGVVLTACYILQRTDFFSVLDNPSALQEYLQKGGAWMPVFYILLQFLQVVLLPIPSIVSTVAGVPLFGAFWAMVYSLIGILLGSFVAFTFGRRFGYRAAKWIIGEENLRKWQKKLKGKDNTFLTVMFLLPLFPDDALCFIAGLSSMSTRYFITVIFFSRFLGIFTTCYSFDFIPFNTWWGQIIWVTILVGIIFGLLFLRKNMDKMQRALKRYQNKRKR